MERFIENAMYASRWLLAPIYFGLSLSLLALALKFFQEVFHILPNVFALAEADLILVLLSLIDMALVGGLLVMDDDFRLRELRFPAGYQRGHREAQLAGQDGLQLAEDESGGFHRGDFLDPSAQSIYECAEHPTELLGALFD